MERRSKEGGWGVEKRTEKNACTVFPTEIVGDLNHIISVDINDQMKDETRKKADP
jgi:hypothetical protein